MTQKPSIVMLDDSAIGYVRSQLSEASGWNETLSLGLLSLPVAEPFALLSPVVHDRVKADFFAGRVDSEMADTCFAEATSNWLSADDSDDVKRVAVFTDVISRRSDPRLTDGDDRFLGDCVFCVASAGATPSEVSFQMSKAYGYPGIGVLSRVPVERFRAQELSDADIKAAVTGAAAILVRAWDDEAFVIAPVDGRLSPGELSCT